MGLWTKRMPTSPRTSLKSSPVPVRARRGVEGADAADQLQSVHGRHDHVDDDEIEAVGVEAVDGIRPAQDAHRFVAERPHERAEALVHVRLVVDDHHSHGGLTGAR